MPDSGLLPQKWVNSGFEGLFVLSKKGRFLYTVACQFPLDFLSQKA
jgi:hypothetical protein